MFRKQEIIKKIIIKKILKYLPKNINVLGLGTGTTIKYIIKDLLINKNIKKIVSSSITTTLLINKYFKKVLNLNKLKIYNINIYIDSADQIDHNLNLLKGQGGALTNEKIINNFSKFYFCILDKYKLVNKLGNKKVPLILEVLPIAINYIANYIKKINNNFIIIKKKFLNEHGNYIIYIYNIIINNPIKIEKLFNNLPGVVNVGIFSIKKPNLAFIFYKNKINKLF